MSACGDIIEMEMTEGKLLKDEHQFWCSLNDVLDY